MSNIHENFIIKQAADDPLVCLYGDNTGPTGSGLQPELKCCGAFTLPYLTRATLAYDRVINELGYYTTDPDNIWIKKAKWIDYCLILSY